MPTIRFSWPYKSSRNEGRVVDAMLIAGMEGHEGKWKNT